MRVYTPSVTLGYWVGKGGLVEQKGGPPSLYVGESPRTVQEQAVEHHDAARKRDKTSHMRRHKRLVHGAMEPKFIFKVVSHHRSALNRQIKEAVSIRRRGGAQGILNSKVEFNRCYIPRLVVEVEDQATKEQREQRE